MRSISTALAVLICLASTTAGASSVRYRTDAQLIAQADRVVHGRVISQRTARGGSNARAIYTVTTVAVIEDLTGVDGDTVEIWELGGTIGSETMYVDGAVRFEVGAEVIVCLRQGRLGLQTVGMGLSTFDLQPDATGGARLSRNLGGLLVVDGTASSSGGTLDEFRRLAGQVTGRAARQGGTPDAAVRHPLPRQTFTYIGDGLPGFSIGARWFEADSGLAIHVYTNLQPAPPAFGFNLPAQVQTALAAWTNPPAASVALQYSGTTTQPSEKPWDDTIPPNSILITFEDPDNDIYDPILAMTTVFTISDNSTPRLHGTSFDRITDAVIKFQNVADMPESFRQSVNFSRLLAHEVGHTIGLGHAQENGSVANPSSNIMYATCCFSETPVPPALGPDDLTGLVFVYPADSACKFVVSPPILTMPATASGGQITLATYADCGWTVSNTTSFVTLTSASSGVGSAIVSFSVAANPGQARSGTLTIGGQAVSVTQASDLPIMTLDKSSLVFGAATSGSTFAARTSAQVIRLLQGGNGSVTWTTASNQPWLQVDRASGSGSATLSISVVPTLGLPPSGTLTGTIVVSFTGAAATTGAVGVTLTLRPNGSSEAAFGVVDTPAQTTSGITGAVPFTGWAIDDIDVAAVSVCRAAVAGESVGADARCGGAAQAYISDAVFIDGARGDVQAGYGSYPRNSQAGWGVMVLTNMLPGQGNGTYEFFIYARDAEGRSTLLGTRTMTCDNAHATLPFGTIDTPMQGETVSGTAMVNFGWALTQNPKIIPTDGSTLRVYVDGALVGVPSYNHYRADIATLFPGLANSDGAVGFKVLDTTTLTNGLHTIVWTATDSGGFTEGLGSRYFNVSNGAGGSAAVTRQAQSAAVTARGVTPATPVTGTASLTAAALESVPLDPAALTGRRGWSPDAPWRAYEERAGRIVVRGEELDRFELLLPEAGVDRYSGYVRSGGGLTALPAGSRLVANAFTWSPGVGFVGTYNLVFVRSSANGVVSRQEVRIIIRPKSTGQVGPQVVIDTPATGQDVGELFAMGGWAADLDADDGVGIDTVHVWAYPAAGGTPQFVGVASLGGARPDVAAVHGDQFQDSGYGVMVRGLAPGSYDLAVFAWSRLRGGFAPAATVRVSVR